MAAERAPRVEKPPPPETAFTIGVGFVQGVVPFFGSALYPKGGPLEKEKDRDKCWSSGGDRLEKPQSGRSCRVWGEDAAGGLENLSAPNIPHAGAAEEARREARNTTFLLEQQGGSDPAAVQEPAGSIKGLRFLRIYRLAHSQTPKSTLDSSHLAILAHSFTFPLLL